MYKNYYCETMTIVYIYRMAQKSKPLPNDQKVVLNCIKACQYSMCDLLSDLNKHAWPQTSHTSQIR